MSFNLYPFYRFDWVCCLCPYWTKIIIKYTHYQYSSDNNWDILLYRIMLLPRSEDGSALLRCPTSLQTIQPHLPQYCRLILLRSLSHCPPCSSALLFLQSEKSLLVAPKHLLCYLRLVSLSQTVQVDAIEVKPTPNRADDLLRLQLLAGFEVLVGSHSWWDSLLDVEYTVGSLPLFSLLL